jgi:hypothetical protein
MSSLSLAVSLVSTGPKALLGSGIALGDRSPMLWLIGGASTPDFWLATTSNSV